MLRVSRLRRIQFHAGRADEGLFCNQWRVFSRISHANLPNGTIGAIYANVVDHGISSKHAKIQHDCPPI